MKVAYYGLVKDGMYLVPESFYDVNGCCFDQDISIYDSEEDFEEDLETLEEQFGEFEDYEEILDCFRLGVAARKCGLKEIAESWFEISEDIEVVKSKMHSLDWDLKEYTLDDENADDAEHFYS